MTIKAVVFDFGGVLLAYDNLTKAWQEIDKKYGLPLGSIAKATKGVEFSEWCGEGRSVFHGTLSVEEVESGLFTEFINYKLGVSITDHLKPLSIVLEAGLNHTYNKKLCSVLSQLKSLGLQSALLTNNCYIDKAQQKQRLPFDLSVFDVVVESCVEHEVKPEPAIYEITSKRLGLKPEELVFLDDLKENCDAAVALGWKAIHVDIKNEDRAVEALEQLLGLKFEF